MNCQNCGGPRVQEDQQCFYCGALNPPLAVRTAITEGSTNRPPEASNGELVAERIQRAAIRLRGPFRVLAKDTTPCCLISNYDYTSLLMFLSARAVYRDFSINDTKFEGVQCFAGGRKIIVAADRNLRAGDLVL